MAEEIPANITDLVVKNVMEIDAIASAVDFVFDAVDIKTPTGGSDKEAVRALEEAYAMRETPVVSAASAYRWTPDVPMIIPEINPEHLSIIPVQRKRLGTLSGFVAVKPNCSIQPYVPALHALAQFRP